jgi:hypothetical protein
MGILVKAGEEIGLSRELSVSIAKELLRNGICGDPKIGDASENGDTNEIEGDNTRVDELLVEQQKTPETILKRDNEFQSAERDISSIERAIPYSLTHYDQLRSLE